MGIFLPLFLGEVCSIKASKFQMPGEWRRGRGERGGDGKKVCPKVFSRSPRPPGPRPGAKYDEIRPSGAPRIQNQSGTHQNHYALFSLLCSLALGFPLHGLFLSTSALLTEDVGDCSTPHGAAHDWIRSVLLGGPFFRPFPSAPPLLAALRHPCA